jgi:hypothetical protein
MIQTYAYCPTCKVLVRISGEIHDIRRVTDLATTGYHKCVTTGCGGSMNRISYKEAAAYYANETKHSHVELLELSAQEFLKAVVGFGLPNEINADPEIVESLLKSNQIVSVEITKSKTPGRSVLNSLSLNNGLTIHVASGAEGPTVYKITRKNDRATTVVLSNSKDNEVQREDSTEAQRNEDVDTSIPRVVDGGHDIGTQSSSC